MVNQADLLRSGIRVLEAGCGTGALTLAFHEAISKRALTIDAYHAFDLTPAMMDVLREKLTSHGISGVELREADVLAPHMLPANWQNYDLLLSASMLEYVPRQLFAAALAGLRLRIASNGRILLFITKDNLLMRPLVGRLWRSNLYTAPQLQDAFASAGFSDVRFLQFPPAHRHLALWGHVVMARP